MRAFLILAAFLPAFALAQGAPQRIKVTLSSLNFTPSTIRLTAGRLSGLHLVNSCDGGHNFAAPEFFAAAQRVSGPVREGRVEVAGRSSAEIAFTPARGAYRLRCTHTLHTALGMSGEIIVE